MLKPSDFNNAVPQFSNGNYASNPINPQYVEEPSSTDYNRGTEPLQTLPAQWWNWFINKFTSRFNKVNIYVKNLFNELAQLLSLVNVTPDGTEGAVTDGQLKNAFKELYPDYINTKLALESTYVKKTQKVNGHALSGDVTVTKSDVGLGNVPNVSTNDQTPTYTEASTLTALSSGEKLSIAFGKLAKAVSSLISHIANVSNPHSVTKAQVGLGSVVNTGDSATPVENGTTKFTTGGAYTLKKDLTDIASSLPTDAVLHYSFDEVPDYPDGTADVRILNGQTYEIEYGSYAFNPNDSNATISNSDGTLVCTINNSAFYLGSAYRNKIFKCQFEITSINGELAIHNGYQNVIKRITKKGIYEVMLLNTNEQTPSNIYFYCSGTNYSCVFRVLKVYCGDGSYSTPIIDNANGQNNATNNGGIAVQGVSGKGAYFLQGKYSDVGTDFNLNANFSISVWAKADNTTSRLNGNIFVKDSHFILRNGADFVNGDYLMLYLYDENETNLTQGQGNIGYLLPNKWTHIVIVRDGTSLKSYRNGVLNKTITLANATISKNTNVCSISNSLNTRPQSIDDLLIFDRALTENEVMALYLNKANTPKYYGEVPVTRKVNGYALDKDITLAKSDVGLGNVVNTGDSAIPVSGGTTKFTTGGAYNLLTSLAPIFSTSTSYAVGDMVTYNGRLYTCTTAHSAGAWNASHFTVNDFNSFYNFTGGAKEYNKWLQTVFGWSMGVNWVDSNIQKDGPHSLIEYGNGLWLTIVNQKYLYKSTDGKIWTDTGYVFINGVDDLIYSNNMWMATCNAAVGQGVWWSTDGETWARGTGNYGNSLVRHPYYGNGMWLISVYGTGSSDAKGIWWSTNGKAWSQGTGANQTYSTNTFVYGNGIWVAGMASHGFWWSTDGKSWTQNTGSSTSTSVLCLYYHDGLFIGGTNANGIWYSVGGKKWTQCTGIGSSYRITCLLYSNGLWIAGTYEHGLWWSNDGIRWNQSAGNSTSYTIMGISYSNGIWIAGTSQHGVYRSTNGKSWVQVNEYMSSYEISINMKCDGYTWVIGSYNNGILWSSCKELLNSLDN